MNLLDRAIGYIWPQTGMARARARHAIRIYEGASTGRRAASWSAIGSSANTELQSAIRPLRDRSRDLTRNTPHAARMLDIVAAHAVGNGLVPVSTTGSDKIDNKVMELWEEWNKHADVTGRMTFYAMQVLAVRSMVESGEVVARFIDTPLNEKTCVPFQIQLLESDFIDHYRDGIYGTAAGGPKSLKISRLGVGLGEYDKWVGLWLWPYHPGEMTTIHTVSLNSEFIERDNLLHVFKVLRPGQVRGVPWFTPIMTTARDNSDFMDAVNVKARVEACFAGFITNDDSSMPLLDQTPGDSVIGMPNVGTTSLEPGMLKELRSGQDIKFATPTSTSQVDTILLNNLQAMAAGVGCTYDQITGDLRQANYSSLRAGKLDFWRLIGQLQTITLIPMLCQPTWDRFISRAILAGRLPQRRGGYPCDWVVPAKEMIDPKKDFDASKNAVRAGAMTPQQFMASFGGNWRDNLTDFKAFFEMAHEAGVTLDIDVARVDQHGRQPPAKGQPTDPKNDAEDAASDATDDAANDALDEAA
jgi:lambda family phage portal protein